MSDKPIQWWIHHRLNKTRVVLDHGLDTDDGYVNHVVAYSALEKANARIEKLRAALEFYANGQHLNEDDHDVVELECEGSSMTDHVVGKAARAALEEDGE